MGGSLWVGTPDHSQDRAAMMKAVRHPRPNGAEKGKNSTPSPGRTLTSVVANYQVVGGASGQVTLTDGGSGVYSGDIPTAPDGAFVTVTVTATDSEGASSTTPVR